MSDVQVLPYAIAVSLLVMMPGADFAVVLRSSIASGRKAGSAAGFGIVTGLLVWTAAVATGLGALLAASATAYSVLKMAGVAFLLFLGVMSLRSALHRRDLPSPDIEVATRGLTVRAAYLQGLLTNMLNPKVALTFLALMPQFLPSDPSPLQFLVLCATTVLLSTGWFQLVAVVVAGFGSMFRRDAVRRTLEAVTGTVLLAFGVRLATD